MKIIKLRPEKPQTDYQRIFAQSKVNGAEYTGEELPARHWDWPKNGWFSRKLRNELPPCLDR